MTSRATISMLPIDAPGHVPWWPRPDVKLFNIMVHILSETSRHAGHADILREQLDGAIGTDPGARPPRNTAPRPGRTATRRSSGPPGRPPPPDRGAAWLPPVPARSPVRPLIIRNGLLAY